MVTLLKRTTKSTSTLLVVAAATTVLALSPGLAAAQAQATTAETIETPRNAYRVSVDDRMPDERGHYMPYTPTIVQFAGSDIIWLAGATALPLYHQHNFRPPSHEPKDIAALPRDIYSQTKLTLRNISRQLESVGAEWTDVVNCTAFVVNLLENGPAVNRAMGEVLGPHFKHPQGMGSPGGSLIGVASLVDKENLIEMSCQAALPPSRRSEALKKVAPR